MAAAPPGLMPLTAIRQLDRAARRQIYGGHVCVLRQVGAARRLCEHFAAAYLRGCEGASSGNSTASPAGVDGSCSGEIKNQKNHQMDITASDIPAFCERFERDAVVLGLYREILLDACGVDARATCWDRVRLRVQQSGAGVDVVDDVTLHGSGKYSSTLPIHRDTWASNIMPQINVWMPLAEIDAGRTLAIHPTFFNAPVPNSSAAWDFGELKRARKAQEPYPQLPMLVLDGDDDDSTNSVDEAYDYITSSLNSR